MSYGIVNIEIFHRGRLLYDFCYNTLEICHIFNDIIVLLLKDL